MFEFKTKKQNGSGERVGKRTGIKGVVTTSRHKGY